MACIERFVGVNNIALPDTAADFIDPSLLAVGVTLFVSSLYLLTRPVVDRRLSMTGRGAERRLAELRAREIVRRHGRGTLDYFALRDDKQFFFFRDSLIAYAVYGGVALVSPDPSDPKLNDPKPSARSARTPKAGAGRSASLEPVRIGSDLRRGRPPPPLHRDEAIVDCRHSASPVAR